MNKQERKKLINTINKQKNRLVSKGVNPQDLNKYFGYPVTLGLKEVSDNELLKIKQVYQNRPKVEVVNNNIYPKGYTKKHDTALGNGHYANSFNQRFSSQLNSQTVKQIEKNRIRREKTTKENYINGMRELGISEDIISKVQNMSYADFLERVEHSGGMIDINKVIYAKDNEEEEIGISGIKHSLKHDLELFFR